jgi:hypothetical protein
MVDSILLNHITSRHDRPTNDYHDEKNSLLIKRKGNLRGKGGGGMSLGKKGGRAEIVIH